MQRSIWAAALVALFVLNPAHAAVDPTAVTDMPADAQRTPVQRAWMELVEIGGQALRKGHLTRAAQALHDARKLAAGDEFKAVHLAKVDFDLAETLQAMGRPFEAEAHYRAALVTYLNHLGVTHPYVALCYLNLAETMEATGRWALSEGLLEQTAEIFKAKYGPKHVYTAHVLLRQANWYRDHGSPSRAEKLYQETLRVAAEAIPAGDIQHARIFGCYAVHLRRNKKDLEAGRYQEKAEKLRGDIDQLRANPITGWYTRLDMAEEAAGQGRADDAEKILRAALAAAGQKLDDKPWAYRCYRRLCELFAAAEKYDEAGEAGRKAADLAKDLYGEDSAPATEMLLQRGCLERAAKDYEAADETLQTALERTSARWGAHHPAMLPVLEAMAELYLARDRRAQAENILRWQLLAAEKAYGANHPGLAPVLSRYADLLDAMKRPDEAGALRERLKGLARK